MKIPKLGRYTSATVITAIGAVTLIALFALGSPEFRAQIEGHIQWLVGVALLPFLQAKLTRKDSDGDGIPDDRDSTPNGPALALLLALASASHLTACESGAWKAHSIAAQAANETAITGRAMIMGERRRALVAAAQGAADIAAAVRAAGDEWDGENSTLISAYNLFAAAANQYARSAFAALNGDAGALDELAALAMNVASAWDDVVEILNDAADLSLPRLPGWLLEFLRGDAPQTAGGEA
jgi:hypothetical protein